MIKKIDISGIHHEVGDDIKRYIRRKIGKLDRFVPRRARESLHVEVRLTELKTKNDRNQCEVVMHLPEHQVTAKEATVNMFAAVDIVETKLRNQLKKYKGTRGGDKSDHHGVLRRILRGRRNP